MYSYNGGFYTFTFTPQFTFPNANPLFYLTFSRGSATSQAATPSDGAIIAASPYPVIFTAGAVYGDLCTISGLPQTIVAGTLTNFSAVLRDQWSNIVSYRLTSPLTAVLTPLFTTVPATPVVTVQLTPVPLICFRMAGTLTDLNGVNTLSPLNYNTGKAATTADYYYTTDRCGRSNGAMHVNYNTYTYFQSQAISGVPISNNPRTFSLWARCPAGNYGERSMMQLGVRTTHENCGFNMENGGQPRLVGT